MDWSELKALIPCRFPRRFIPARNIGAVATKDIALAIRTILEAMSTALTKGDRIEIRGFGSFDLNFRPPRIGRNPKTGELVQVPGKAVPHFKAGKELREAVDFGGLDQAE